MAIGVPRNTMGVLWGGASVGASPRVYQGGKASDKASPCESRGQPREVPGW